MQEKRGTGIWGARVWEGKGVPLVAEIDLAPDVHELTADLQ